MPGKVSKGKWKKLSKKQIVGICAVVLIGGIGGPVVYQMKKPADYQLESLTAEQQKSLIEVQTKLVKQNTKPKEIKASFKNRLEKLSKENQELAMDLIYTSTQNASFYYNATSQVMSGEVDYNRQDSKSALDAGKNSAWVEGYIKDIEDQGLIANSLSGNFILNLPDFQSLKNYNKYSSKELQVLVKYGSEAQSKKIFNQNGEVNPLEAARAYEIILKGIEELTEINSQSKYLADLNSLARIYHDIALGYVQTPNLELQKDGTYKLNQLQTDSLKQIQKEATNLEFITEVTTLLKQVKDGKILASDLKNGAKASQTKFGSSVFWQGDLDLESAVTKQNQLKTGTGSEGENK